MYIQRGRTNRQSIPMESPINYRKIDFHKFVLRIGGVDQGPGPPIPWARPIGPVPWPFCLQDSWAVSENPLPWRKRFRPSGELTPRDLPTIALKDLIIRAAAP